MKLNLVKWRLMLTTLPITLVVLLIKIGIVDVLHYDGLVKFSEISLVITGGIFLIGFMLAGTLTDYKESEKIPAEMACCLASIDDTMTVAYNFKSEFDLMTQRKQLYELTQCLLRYFAHQETEKIVFEKIDQITSIALCVERTGIGSTSSWVKREQNNLRVFFSRTTVIKRTHFLSTGYAFLEVLTVFIIGLMMISKFENQVMSAIMIGFITQIFVYMIRLIKDIDHPFEYPASGKVRAADIDLFPLVEYGQRVKEKF